MAIAPIAIKMQLLYIYAFPISVTNNANTIFFTNQPKRSGRKIIGHISVIEVILTCSSNVVYDCHLGSFQSKSNETSSRKELKIYEERV